MVPKLQAAGWENAPFSIAEQRYFTNPKGRIRVVGGRIVRGKPKRADYLLRYRRDFPIAVVEAKADYKTPGAALGQAKEYAADSRPQVRLRHQRQGHCRVRLHYRNRARPGRLSYAGGALGAAERQRPALRSRHRDGPRTIPSRPRTPASLLPANRHQPRRRGHPARQESHPPDDGNRHGQDRRRLPNLLQTLGVPLESRQRPHQAPEDSLPRRPQHPRG